MSNTSRKNRRSRKHHDPRQEKQTVPKAKKPVFSKKQVLFVWLPLLGVLILAMCLNTAALHWAQTGDVSWNPDSLGGRITAAYMPHLFKKWTHKYPRGQFLINSVFYKPKINQWNKDPVLVTLPDGRSARTPLNQERLYELATISRRVTVFMSLGIIVAVFLTVRKLFDDDLAAILSALCLALSCLFMFYAQSACVDVPAFFWFAWAGCFGLYAIKSDKLIYYLLAGFCSAWSVCTKEGVATFHIGLAAALAVLLVHSQIKAGNDLKKAFRSLLNWKIIAAVLLAVFVFAAMQGMLGGLEEWRHRSQSWKSVVEDEFQAHRKGIGKLLIETGESLHTGWGLPFLVLLVISLIYWIVKYRWQLALAIFPLFSFFFLTVLILGHNLPRFMICGYAGIAIVMGKALADWYRFKPIPLPVRYALPLFVLLPSLICCVFYDLEMRNDTRTRAEQWMRTSAKSEATVGLSMMKIYAPNVWLDGFRTIPEWDSKGMETKQGKVKVWPDYIIASNQWPARSRKDYEFSQKMFKNETQYVRQAGYDKLYFRQDRKIWKYCLRFFDLHPRVSPGMFIYKRSTTE